MIEIFSIGNFIILGAVSLIFSFAFRLIAKQSAEAQKEQEQEQQDAEKNVTAIRPSGSPALRETSMGHGLRQTGTFNKSMAPPSARFRGSMANFRRSHMMESRYLDQLLTQRQSQAQVPTKKRLLQPSAAFISRASASGMTAEEVMMARLSMYRQSSLFRAPAGMYTSNNRVSAGTFTTDEFASSMIMRTTMSQQSQYPVLQSAATGPVPRNSEAGEAHVFQSHTPFASSPQKASHHSSSPLDENEDDLESSCQTQNGTNGASSPPNVPNLSSAASGASRPTHPYYLGEERALRQSMGVLWQSVAGGRSSSSVTSNNLNVHNGGTGRSSGVHMAPPRSSTQNPMNTGRMTEMADLAPIPSMTESELSVSELQVKSAHQQNAERMTNATFASEIMLDDGPDAAAEMEAVLKEKIVLPFIPNMEQLLYFWTAAAFLSCVVSFFHSAQTGIRPVAMTKLFQISCCAMIFIASSTYRMQIIAPFPYYVQCMLQSPVIFTPLAILCVFLSGEGGVPNWQQTSAFFLISNSSLINMAHFGAGNFISILLNPAIVSLAFTTIEPIFEYAALMVYVTPWSIAVCMVVYLICATLSFICQSPASIALPLLVRTVTTPIALAISAITGGTPSLTAASVVINGVIALRVDAYVLDYWKVEHPPTRGLAMGITGTLLGVVALDERKESLAASIGMAGYAIATVIFALLMAITPLEQFLVSYA